MSLFFILMLSVPVHGGVDHSEFIESRCLTGEDVTRTCLGCHEESARNFMETAHWQWTGPTPYLKGHTEDVMLGKKNLINDY